MNHRDNLVDANCNNFACHNGGICHVTGTWPSRVEKCDCRSGYTGIHCDAAVTVTMTSSSATAATTTPTRSSTTMMIPTRQPTSTSSPITDSTTSSAHKRYVCESATTLSDLSNHVTSHNEASASCVNGDHAGSEALVLNHCNVGRTMSWSQGENVMSLCDGSHARTPIATFSNGAYRQGFDVAGIFLGCEGQQVKVGIQTCQWGTKTETFTFTNDVGYANAALYFVIQ